MHSNLRVNAPTPILPRDVLSARTSEILLRGSVLFCVWMAFVLTPRLAVASESLESFRSEILPVLAERCFACHGIEKSEGDLRFDRTRLEVQSGGHTGNSILGTSAETSELFRRITSKKPGYRMPKKGHALDALQVASFERWLNAGAAWDDDAVRQAVGDLPGKPSRPATSTTSDDDAGHLDKDRRLHKDGRRTDSGNWSDAAGAWFVEWSNSMQRPANRNLFWIQIAFAVFLALAMYRLIRGLPLANNDPALESKHRYWLVLRNHLVVALLFLLLFLWQSRVGDVLDQRQQIAKLKTELATYSAASDEDPLEPPFPMHPPRLGGVYYRGNDERDASLFNGGFYRTATLEVWLTDGEGRQLAWGDSLADECLIRFEIKRAAGTTGELFSEQVMSVVRLTDTFDRSTESTEIDSSTPSTSVKMQMVDPQQHWTADFSIGDPRNWPGVEGSGTEGERRLQGKLFVVQQTSRPKAHYAIEYDLRAADTERGGMKLLDSSRLWMGSLYHLNGRVLIPRHDRILLDRWFDFRPIPEIEGSNSSDPALLGIPEHLGSQRSQ